MKRGSSLWIMDIVAAMAAYGPAASIGQQQTAPQDFRQVDYYWSQNPQLLQNLWETARTHTVRIAELGDSQETSPGSKGSQFMPLLNYELWKRFGNAPETPVQGCSNYGAGAPPADWLLRGVCANPGPAPTRLQGNRILPNISPAAFSTLNTHSNVTHGSYGQLTLLQQDAIDVDPGAAIPTNVDYFNTSGVVKARIFAATNASSGEVSYKALPTASHVPSYSAPATTIGTLALGLESASFAVKSGDTAALDFNGQRYMALEVFGSDDSKLTDIIGMRFFNETHPEGVIVDTFSHGGYTAKEFLAVNGNAGAMFRAFGFQAAIVHYGANETDETAEQFETDIAAVITRVRSWVGDPSFPVILIADVYQDGLTAAQASEYDKFVGAELAIAQTDGDAMVINSRRLMDDIGWNGTSGQSDQFLRADGIHYTAHGAQVLAKAEVAAMMNEIRVTGCPADPDNVALPSTATLTVEIGGATVCTGYGQYTASKSLTLNQPILNVVLTNGFTPSLGLQFKLLSWGTLSGTFGNVVLPQLPTGLTWNTGGLYTTGTITVDPSALPTINITSGADQSLTSPGAAAPIAFTLSGPGTLTVIGRSSNTGLLPQSGISVSPGCGSTRETCTASIAIASGQTGSATVSLTVDDVYGQAATATATIEVGSGTNAGSAGSGGGAGGSGGGNPGSGSGTGGSSGGNPGSGSGAGGSSGGSPGSGSGAGGSSGGSPGSGSGTGGSSGGSPGSGSGTGGSSSGNTVSGAGGGNLDILSLLGLAGLATYKQRRRGGGPMV